MSVHATRLMWFFDGVKGAGFWSPDTVAQELGAALPESAALQALARKALQAGNSLAASLPSHLGSSLAVTAQPCGADAALIHLDVTPLCAAGLVPLEQVQSLLELGCELSRQKHLGDVWTVLTSWLRQAGAGRCQLWLGEAQLQRRLDTALTPPATLKTGENEALLALLRQPAPLLLPAAHPLAARLPSLCQGEMMLWLPVSLTHGGLALLLCEWNEQRAPATLSDMALLASLTTLLRHSLDRERTHALELDGHRWSQQFDHLSQALSARTGMGFLDTLINQLLVTFGLDGAWLAERSGHGRAHLLAGRGEHPDQDYPLVDSLCEPVYLGQPVLTTLAAARYYYGLPLHNGHGMVCGHLALVGSDTSRLPDIESVLQTLSSRIAAELERLQVEAQLRLSAVAFETHEGIIITDPAFTILRVNKAFTEITGYESRDVLGCVLGEGIWQRGGLDYRLDHLNRWQGETERQRCDGSSCAQWERVTPVPDERGHITHFVICFEDISERKAAQRTIQDLAYYDELTGLPNRRQLQESLAGAFEQAKQSESIGALLFIDLDHFKTINDSLGHATGDWLLRQVADRLQRLIRQEDILARLGGDEFVLLLPRLSTSPPQAEMQADLIGERLIAELSTPYPFEGQSLHIGASVGITLFPGRDQSVDDLLKQADTAMYQAKSAGRRTLRFFDSSMQQQADQRLLINNELRSALDNNELLLYYQPQHMVDCGELTGVEALLRWQPPGRGMISPAEFIPIAEETDLIVDIGFWVLLQACHQFVAWQEAGLHIPQLSVNVSAKQFHAPDFVERVYEALAITGMEPACLNLEITESVVLGHAEDTIQKMAELKALGISFAIDDFGAGYSSLSYLKRLPADELKIDRSFIQDIPHDADNMAIVEAVLAMARHMGFSVTAEGVESRQQLAFLQAQGCNFYQGFLASKPLPEANLRRYVSRLAELRVALHDA